MRFHHIGFAVEDVEAEIIKYKAMGGRNFSRVYEDFVQNVKIVFFDFGGITYELVAPLGEPSPVDGFLKKNIRMYHVCFEVCCLEEEISEFEKSGGLLILPPTKAVALQDRRVSFVLALNGDLIELLEAQDATAP